MYRSRRLKGWNLVGLGIAMLLPLILMAVWNVDYSEPISLTGDNLLGDVYNKSIIQYGIKGIWFCPALGAPEVAKLIDTPFISYASTIKVFLIGLLTSNIFTIQHLLYLTSFVFASFTMYMLLNRMMDRVFLKTFFSVAFAVTPYHFLRNTAHLSLSYYYPIPTAIYLMLLIWSEDFKGPVPARYLRQKWKIVIMYACCLYLGFSNIYYAFFGLFCMAIGLLIKLVEKKKLSVLWKEAVPMYAILLAVALTLLPSKLYASLHGANTAAIVRPLSDSEFYSLKIIQLLLPPGNSRIPILARLNATYSAQAYNINENVASSLGLIASIGFLLCCVWIIGRIIKQQLKDRRINRLLDLFSLAVLALVLYSVNGGFGIFVNFLITAEIRCLNRSSIVIACLSICAFAVGAEYLLNTVKLKRDRIAGIVALLLVGAFAAYSEVPVQAAGWQSGLKSRNAMLKTFFSSVEDSLEEDAMVYELPFMQFPEAGYSNKMLDYELGLGYVYTNHLRWSYGAVRGRNHAAESLYVDAGMSVRFVQGILDAGFSGVYLDTLAYADGGEAVNAFYRDVLALTPIVSGDGRHYFYKIAGLDFPVGSSGYPFVKQFADRNGVQADAGTVLDVAAGLENYSPDALVMMWTWAEAGPDDLEQMSDTDFVKYLYRTFLGREEEQPEGWANLIAEGSMTRREVFDYFLLCPEFRMNRGFRDPDGPY